MIQYLPALALVLIASVNLRYQWPNLKDAYLDYRAVQAANGRMHPSTYARVHTRYQINLWRSTVVPLMLLVGLGGLLVVAFPFSVGLRIADTVLLLIAIYGNEVAFGVINWLEHRYRERNEDTL